MFRRFMVVCWVLLGSAAIATAIGAVGFSNTLSMMRNIGDEVAKPTRADNHHDIFYYWHDLQANTRPTAGSNEGIIKILDQFFEPEVWSETVDSDVSREIALRNAKTRVRLRDEIVTNAENATRLYSIAETYTLAQSLGLLFMGVLLVWNIIWHVGHWIWMGRQTE